MTREPPRDAEPDERLRRADEELLTAIRRALAETPPEGLREVGYITFALREGAPEALIAAVYEQAGAARINQVLSKRGVLAARLAQALLRIPDRLNAETRALANAAIAD